ncbi:MAG: DUF559 domain-containing protein [Actinomycetota bacterium]
MLWLRTDCVLSHSTAARMWGFEGFERTVVEISSSHKLRGRDFVKVHHASRLPPIDITERNNLPVTTLPRTLVDVASQIPVVRLEALVEQALSRRLCDLDQIDCAANRKGGKGVAGIEHIRRLLTELEGDHPGQSELERRMTRLLRSRPLPRFISEYPIQVADRMFYADFANPELGIIVEVDGWQWHSGTRKWQSDLERRNLLTNAGWVVLHFTWRDVQDRPDWVIEQIRIAASHREDSRFPTLFAERKH